MLECRKAITNENFMARSDKGHLSRTNSKCYSEKQNMRTVSSKINKIRKRNN